MGRVYNALVKADRLTGRERPIGRPASGDVAAKDAEGFPKQVASITTRENSAADFSFDHASAASAPVFQSDSNFSLTETFAAPRAIEPRDAQPIAGSFLPRPAIDPCEIADVKSLTIEPHLVALTGSDALACERYRTLAVRIINAASRRRLKTIVITSAERGEGKSTVAINLAWAMAARSNLRVLLIDTNRPSPSINRLLGLSSRRGWLDLIDDPSGLAGAVTRIDPNGLYVMPAGTQEATASLDDILASSRFEKFLAELNARFDFVIIDAPPLIGSADAQQLAAIADGTVIVARAGVTHHNRVSAALALVPEDRRVGIVLNESGVGEAAATHKSGRSLLARLLGREK
jgi:capsular exopolysaccharide synthesis family protein